MLQLINFLEKNKLFILLKRIKTCGSPHQIVEGKLNVGKMEDTSGATGCEGIVASFHIVYECRTGCYRGPG